MKKQLVTLENARLHEPELQEAMQKIWYDEKYQYYFDGLQRSQLTFFDDSMMAFTVMVDGQLIGLIRYHVDMITRVATQLAAINFTEDRLAFALGLRTAIKECFNKYGITVVEWAVVCGNPVEQSYDHICCNLGGRIIGYQRNRVQDMAGKIHDVKLYEITREDFLEKEKNRKAEMSSVPNPHMLYKDQLKDGFRIIYWRHTEDGSAGYVMSRQSDMLIGKLLENIRQNLPRYREMENEKVVTDPFFEIDEIVYKASEDSVTAMPMDRTLLMAALAADQNRKESLVETYLNSIGLKKEDIIDNQVMMIKWTTANGAITGYATGKNADEIIPQIVLDVHAKIPELAHLSKDEIMKHPDLRFFRLNYNPKSATIPTEPCMEETRVDPVQYQYEQAPTYADEKKLLHYYTQGKALMLQWVSPQGDSYHTVGGTLYVALDKMIYKIIRKIDQIYKEMGINDIVRLDKAAFYISTYCPWKDMAERVQTREVDLRTYVDQVMSQKKGATYLCRVTDPVSKVERNVVVIGHDADEAKEKVSMVPYYEGLIIGPVEPLLEERNG